jgi:hypothetical protein
MVSSAEDVFYVIPLLIDLGFYLLILSFLVPLLHHVLERYASVVPLLPFLAWGSALFILAMLGLAMGRGDVFIVSPVGNSQDDRTDPMDKRVCTF